MKSMTMRTGLHYLLAMALMGVYGNQVCPFLESLTTIQLLLPIVVALSLQAGIRFLLEQHIQNLDYKLQVQRQFTIDFTLFLISGIALCIFNTLVYAFPVASGAKIVVGLLILGFLIACELGLYRQFLLANTLKNNGQSIITDDTPYPLAYKFTWFAILCASAIVGVIFLVINKDLMWLADAGKDIPLSLASTYILGEIAFVVVVLMAYIVSVIFGFSRNLRLFLEAENSTLKSVANGNYNVDVPVTSNDEFGVMATRTNAMIRSLIEQDAALRLTQDASILSLASLAETRDNETGAHILRTQNYVKALAKKLQLTSKFQSELDDETIELLYKSAPLHDIGKVGIPDNILLKPGKLTDQEFDVMKQHPQIGADALADAEARLGSNSFLRLASEISLTHHEKWDGSGYPNKLSGTEIPLSGRLMALADVYDALISERIYKPAFSHDKARDIISEGRGTHFDPDIVDAFLSIELEFVRIANEFGDTKQLAA